MANSSLAYVVGGYFPREFPSVFARHRRVLLIVQKKTVITWTVSENEGKILYKIMLHFILYSITLIQQNLRSLLR